MSFQTRDEISALLRDISSSLTTIKTGFKRYDSKYVSKRNRDQLALIVSKWFDETQIIVNMGLKEDLLKPCDEEFKKLSEMIQDNLRKNRCQKTIIAITSELRKLLLIVSTTRFNRLHELNQILTGIEIEKIPDLSDAIKCAHLGIYKASAILGWGAAMFCIRCEIEKDKFEKLNRICKEASKSKKKYRRLKDIGIISNRASLQEIHDADILLIAECYNIIDLGQSRTLHSHKNVRNGAAHSGDATITRQKLLELYSDLNEFIFSRFHKHNYFGSTKTYN